MQFAEGRPKTLASLCLHLVIVIDCNIIVGTDVAKASIGLAVPCFWKKTHVFVADDFLATSAGADRVLQPQGFWADGRWPLFAHRRISCQDWPGANARGILQLVLADPGGEFKVHQRCWEITSCLKGEMRLVVMKRFLGISYVETPGVHSSFNKISTNM